MTEFELIEDSIQVYFLGYTSFRKITNSPAGQYTGHSYRKYLGMPETVLPGGWLRNADPELRRHVVERAKQLLGPHGYTIYMMWRAQCQR